MEYNSLYNVFNPVELVSVLNNVTEENDEIHKFFSTFSFNKIINQNLDKGNSVNIFKNIIKENTTKSKITSALNKLNNQNLSKIYGMIREITFQTEDELNELVNQSIEKIKNDSGQIKPVVSALCFELLSTYFLTSTDEKIYFRKLLLTAVKNDYIRNMDYTREDWTKEDGDSSMTLIGVLFNSKIIDDKIMTSIISELKNRIKYNSDGDEQYFSNVEKAINQLYCLISTIVKNEDTVKIYGNLDMFLENEMNIYEDKKCISRKIRLICKNCIKILRNN